MAVSRLPTPSGPGKDQAGWQRLAGDGARQQLESAVADDVSERHALTDRRAAASAHRISSLRFLSFFSFLSSVFLSAAAEHLDQKPRSSSASRPCGSAGAVVAALGRRRGADAPVVPRRGKPARLPASAATGGFDRLPNSPASVDRAKPTAAWSGHIVGRLRALDEVLGVDHRPRLDAAVAVDDLDVIAAAVRQLAGQAADVDGDDVGGRVEPVRLVRLRGHLHEAGPDRHRESPAYPFANDRRAADRSQPTRR